MRRAATCLIPLALIVAACGGGDDDTDTGDADDGSGTEAPVEDEVASDDGDTDDEAVSDGPPADIPAECVLNAPIEFEISGLPEHSGSFTPESSIGRATPIVPNGDGSLDDADLDEMKELGAQTDLVFFTQWIGDHPFTNDDLGFLSGPEAPIGSITLGLTVVPPTDTPLATGDVVSSTDETSYDTITTFATIGVFFDPADDVDTWFFVNNLDESQGGSAEILYLDDDWMCTRWTHAGGTGDPDGTYSLSGVVLTPIDRADIPFT